MNDSMTDMNDSITDMNDSITNIDDSITGLRNELIWEHEVANTRLLNSMTPLGPFRVIPHKPNREDYNRRDFPRNLSDVQNLRIIQCNRLATAWDLDLDHLDQLDNVEQLNAWRRCLARFMGVTI